MIVSHPLGFGVLRRSTDYRDVVDPNLLPQGRRSRGIIYRIPSPRGERVRVRGVRKS